MGPDRSRCLQAHRQSPAPHPLRKRAKKKSGSFPPPALPGFNGRMTLSDSRPGRRLEATLRPLPSPLTGLPDCPNHLSDVPCPLPRRIERVLVSIASPLLQPSPNGRRVGIRIVTFEACSGFTHVTARRIAQPPNATLVTRLRPFRLPGRAARQLPDQSTTLRVEPSSTGDPRLRGALPFPDLRVAVKLLSQPCWNTAAWMSQSLLRLIYDRYPAIAVSCLGANANGSLE